MTTALETTIDVERMSAASLLRTVVPELVALTLDAKQAHWNVTGPAFLPLHELTDQIAEDAGAWTDRVAERAVALGRPVDARAATVARVATSFPPGHVADREVIALLGARLDRVAGLVLGMLPQLEQRDPVAHDIAITVLEGVEKHRWMLRAQVS